MLWACGDSDSPVGKDGGSPVVAQIGSEVITLEHFHAWIESRPGSKRRLGRPGGAEQELNRLIEVKLVAAEAQQLGLETDPAFLSQSAQIRARAEREYADLVRRILKQRIERDVVVDEAEIRAAYESAKGRLVTSRIHLRSIAVKDEAAMKEVILRLEAGERFSDLAAEFNLDPVLRENGGDLGPMLRNDVPVELRSSAFLLTAAGQVSEPVPTGETWTLLELVERELAVPRPFESVRGQLERELSRARAVEAFEARLQERRQVIGVQVYPEQLATLGPPARRSVQGRRPARVARDPAEAH